MISFKKKTWVFWNGEFSFSPQDSQNSLVFLLTEHGGWDPAAVVYLLFLKDIFQTSEGQLENLIIINNNKKYIMSTPISFLFWPDRGKKIVSLSLWLSNPINSVLTGSFENGNSPQFHWVNLFIRLWKVNSYRTLCTYRWMKSNRFYVGQTSTICTFLRKRDEPHAGTAC